VAKLDTIVHELYHVDPAASGIRALENADGSRSYRTHGPMFYEDVAEMVREYIATKPDPAVYDFLRDDFAGLTKRFGGVVATTFSNFPSFPQRYMETVGIPASEPCVKLEPLKAPTQPVIYTEDDLHVRQFTEASSRRLTRKGQHCAA
jgi:hypothetical protein